ncbi:MAG: division/cell wall cluster transcriptional repressor MraZ [Acidimicrobiia bacterium]|nr:division/cell wall cluster transcriptional repressor MraZ [Acidimicrobiia bacterium]
MFVGTFEHSLDDKGRVVLPTAFRAHLADGAFLSQYDGCLALWAPDAFAGFVARLQDKVREGEASPNAIRVLTAATSEVKPDSQGRVTVPPRLRTFAGLEQEVVLTGALDHIEFWNPQRWAAISDQGDASLTDAVANLGIY